MGIESEINFLIELLLDHKLQKSTKMVISSRLRDIQRMLKIDKVTIPSLTHSSPNINGTGSGEK